MILNGMNMLHTAMFGMLTKVEQSVYNFELADTDMLFKLFDMYEAEAKRVCGAGYVLPAYDYVLKLFPHIQLA